MKFLSTWCSILSDDSDSGVLFGFCRLMSMFTERL